MIFRSATNLLQIHCSSYLFCIFKNQFYSFRHQLHFSMLFYFLLSFQVTMLNSLTLVTWVSVDRHRLLSASIYRVEYVDALMHFNLMSNQFSRGSGLCERGRSRTHYTKVHYTMSITQRALHKEYSLESITEPLITLIRIFDSYHSSGYHMDVHQVSVQVRHEE